MRPGADSANVRFPPPLLYLGALLLGMACDRLFRTANIWRLAGLGLAAPGRVPIGLIISATGLALMLSGAMRFRSLGTNVRPDKPAKALVTSGIYRITRNPMYLGMSVLYLGLAIALDSLFAIVLLPLVLIFIRKQVIAREERYLERTFGEDYRVYKTRVRRWL
jgi:protein-S-isoprenylcysteine O-methyltransferase Ste14